MTECNNCGELLGDGHRPDSWSGEMLCSECAYDDTDNDNAPFVCPGCYAVGGERCAPGCVDAAIEEENREAIERGDYDRFEDDEDRSDSATPR